VVEEEITVNIHRQPGMGLGISIAGGKGSTPFKGVDEVGLELFVTGILCPSILKSFI